MAFKCLMPLAPLWRGNSHLKRAIWRQTKRNNLKMWDNGPHCGRLPGRSSNSRGRRSYMRGKSRHLRQEHNSTACAGRNDSRDLLKHKCLHVHLRSPGTTAPHGVNYTAVTITDRKEKRRQSLETSVQPMKKSPILGFKSKTFKGV